MCQRTAFRKTTSFKHLTNLCTVCQKLARSMARNSHRRFVNLNLQAVFTVRKVFRNVVSEHLDLAKNYIKRQTAPPPLTSNQVANLIMTLSSTRLRSVFSHTLQTAYETFSADIEENRNSKEMELFLHCQMKGSMRFYAVSCSKALRRKTNYQGKWLHENIPARGLKKLFVYIFYCVYSFQNISDHLHVILKKIKHLLCWIIFLHFVP